MSEKDNTTTSLVKKPYSNPVISEFGDVRMLTLSTSMRAAANSDGAPAGPGVNTKTG